MNESDTSKGFWKYLKTQHSIRKYIRETDTSDNTSSKSNKTWKYVKMIETDTSDKISGNTSDNIIRVLEIRQNKTQYGNISERQWNNSKIRQISFGNTSELETQSRNTSER